MLLNKHYYANELIFKDVTELSPMIVYVQDFCENLYALVGVYPKQILLFKSIQKDIKDIKSILRLKNFSKTRWTKCGAASK